MIASHLELGQLWRCPVAWCVVWKGSGRACLEHLAEKHGGSALKITTNVAQFFPPWTVTRDVWHDALRLDVSGIAVDALLFHEAGSRLVHWYRVYKDPFPHPALRNGVIPRLLSGVGRAMAITRLTHLRISIPSSGAPAGRVPMECFRLATTPVSQARRRRVSFTNRVTTLNEEEINTLNADESPEVPPVSPPLTLPVVMEEAAVISKTGPTPLIMPVVERIEYDSPAAEPVEIQTITPECHLHQDSLHSYFLRMMEGWTLTTYVRGLVDLHC